MSDQKNVLPTIDETIVLRVLRAFFGQTRSYERTHLETTVRSLRAVGDSPSTLKKLKEIATKATSDDLS